MQLHKLYHSSRRFGSSISKSPCRKLPMFQRRSAFWESQECAFSQTSSDLCCWSVGCVWWRGLWSFWGHRQDYHVCRLQDSTDSELAGMLMVCTNLGDSDPKQAGDWDGAHMGDSAERYVTFLLLIFLYSTNFKTIWNISKSDVLTNHIFRPHPLYNQGSVSHFQSIHRSELHSNMAFRL